MRNIPLIAYIASMQNLLRKTNKKSIDAIVCLKRSGFILGAYLSNQLTKSLFIPSEIQSIPSKYKNILLVDDKVCTGKSINKVKRKLLKQNKNIITACLFLESDIETDLFCQKLDGCYKMWYELKQ